MTHLDRLLQCNDPARAHTDYTDRCMLLGASSVEASTLRVRREQEEDEHDDRADDWNQSEEG